MGSFGPTDNERIFKESSELIEATNLGIAQMFSLLLMLEKLGWVDSDRVLRFEETTVSLSDQLRAVKDSIEQKLRNARQEGSGTPSERIASDE